MRITPVGKAIKEYMGTTLIAADITINPDIAVFHWRFFVEIDGD
jgi:hypothetical protein